MKEKYFRQFVPGVDDMITYSGQVAAYLYADLRTANTDLQKEKRIEDGKIAKEERRILKEQALTEDNSAARLNIKRAKRMKKPN